MTMPLLRERTLAEILDRCADGPDTFRSGPCRCGACRTCTSRFAPQEGSKVVGVYTDTDTLVAPKFRFHDDVAYRMRTRPHLYEDAERAVIEQWRADLAHRADLYDVDCHTCRAAVLVVDLTDTCPRCGSPTS